MKPANDNELGVAPPRMGQACDPATFPLGTDMVYVAAGECEVKIGTSKSVYRRFSEVNNQTLDYLKLVGIFLGGRELERLLHRHFIDDNQMRGGEWFFRSGALAEWIDAGCPESLTLGLQPKGHAA